MEEILASIRKIIAEDSSGLRSPAAPQRPGTPYAHAPKSSPVPASSPAPRSGFMSREAFLKSSQPVDPEPASEFHAPVGTPRSNNTSDLPSAATSSRSRPREGVHAIETPSSPDREPSLSFREKDAAPAKESLQAREDVRLKENIQAKETAQPQVAKQQPQPLKHESQARPSGETISIDAASVETVTEETVAVEGVSPVAKEDTPTILTAEPTAPKSAADSDASSIEAQLSELLSEDLNALREGRSMGQADATTAKAGEPKGGRSETPHKEIKNKPADTGADKDGSDPFAFDLGPSPFAQKPEPQRPAPTPPSPSSKPSSMSPFDSQRAIGRASHGERTAPTNGSHASLLAPKASGIEHSVKAPPAASSEPRPESKPESKPDPAAKSRQTFVVPSVSATIGPSRKLEPLSNAFRPAPTPEPVIPAAEVVPEAESAPDRAPAYASEPVRAAEPVRAPEPSPAARDQRDETVPHSTLPATTSDSSLDRPMEDAVADLLRPLLKTWLAENMPKIVERALRREMSERLLPGKKNPLD
jgi:cell pole-organizing protein PopZ